MQSLKPQNLLFSFFYRLPKRQLQFLYHYYLTVKTLGPALNYIFLSDLLAAHFHFCLSILFSFSLYLTLTLCLSVVTLITVRRKRWHSLLQHYSGCIQQKQSLMKCPHHTAPWFITYFCHNALADSCYSTPFTSTTYVSHAERGLRHFYWCRHCECGMTSNDIRIWAKRKLIQPFEWYEKYMVIWEVGFFSNLKTHIYHVYVPVGNKHLYTVQLSWSSFLRQKFKANAFLILSTNTDLGVFVQSLMPVSLMFHLYTCHMDWKSEKD